MARRNAWALWASLVLAGLASPASADEVYCSDTGPRVLNVAMYPFIPEAAAAAFMIKSKFERGCPGLDLRITLDPEYYRNEPGKGILAAEADVYEVDSVFFADFLKLKHPLPLPEQLVADSGPVVDFAKKAAVASGIAYGIPHWICSDFLIFRRKYVQLRNLRSPTEALPVFTETHQGLLMDLEGTSTLGELYLSILVAHYGSPEAAMAKLEVGGHPDPYAVSLLRSFAAMEPAGFGRDPDYHQKEGFYPRQLARGVGSAFVGYSEETHYILDEALNSCAKGACLSEDDLDVAPWPFADEGAKPVAWADMYMLSEDLKDAKMRDALAFVRFMMRRETYEALLIPTSGEAPRYLLPARDDMYRDQRLSDAAKLYPKFRSLMDGVVPVTGEGLNKRLRAIAPKVDCLLPAAIGCS